MYTTVCYVFLRLREYILHITTVDVYRHDESLRETKYQVKPYRYNN